MIREVSEAQWLQMTSSEQSGKAGLLFYTPLCGTCKLAERMLEIVVATGIDRPIYKMNVNFAPKLRERWQIASVPCLALLQQGEPIQLEYSMRSVDYLYELMK